LVWVLRDVLRLIGGKMVVSSDWLENGAVVFTTYNKDAGLKSKNGAYFF